MPRHKRKHPFSQRLSRADVPNVLDWCQNTASWPAFNRDVVNSNLVELRLPAPESFHKLTS